MLTATVASLTLAPSVWASASLPAVVVDDFLTPKSQYGKSIDTRALEPGDLLFSREKTLKSALIRRFSQNGPFSHVGIFVGKDKVIDAVSDSGVREIPISDFISSASSVGVLRAPDLRNEQRDDICLFLASKLGAKYDALGAASAAKVWFGSVRFNLDMGESTSKFYCSELVVKAFEAISIPLLGEPVKWAPNDLAQLTWTEKLKYVGHLKYEP